MASVFINCNHMQIKKRLIIYLRGIYRERLFPNSTRHFYEGLVHGIRVITVWPAWNSCDDSLASDRIQCGRQSSQCCTSSSYATLTRPQEGSYNDDSHLTSGETGPERESPAQFNCKWHSGDMHP